MNVEMTLLDILKSIMVVKILSIPVSKIKMSNKTSNPREHETRWNRENLILPIVDRKGEKMKKSVGGFWCQERKSREPAAGTVCS